MKASRIVLGVALFALSVLFSLWYHDSSLRVAAMIFFTLPASTAIYILSSQLRSDLDLASAVIVCSTLCSFASMSLVLLII